MSETIDTNKLNKIIKSAVVEEITTKNPSTKSQSNVDLKPITIMKYLEEVKKDSNNQFLD